jgi:arginine decarboxylase
MHRKKTALESWTPEKSADLYGIRNWGGGFFAVSEAGEVMVTPRGPEGGIAFSLNDAIRGLGERGLDPPILLRFEDILRERIESLHEGFRRAIEEAGYRGVYRGVYPIKVNQQQQVIEKIAEFGADFHHGLEAGSKAELLAAMATLRDPDALLICNGYKDEEFIDLGLYARRLGLNCVFVIESPSELPLILARSEALDIEPSVGLRIKLSTKAGGYWAESGGDRSVFGLNASQMIDAVDALKAAGKLDRLQLLHYHVGSQITNIRDIRTALTEACRIYTGLVEEGAPMGMLDVGGGLAVDYDGSHTNFKSSSNYSLQEYCADIVEVIQSVMNEAGVDHPVIVSESGRATVAYYSVLLFDIIDVSRFETHPLPASMPDDAHETLRNMMSVAEALNAKNAQECFHDAMYYRDEARGLFKHGTISLRDLSRTEQIFWFIVTRVAEQTRRMIYVPDELEGLDSALADVYYGNFSVFQSLPDSWAIQQLFPIMPIHRLRERPARQAILADITCDSDGKIDRFVDLHDVRTTLPLHELKDDETYHLGVFLVGAYQETLSDLHNLFGDTHVVSVRFGEDGEPEWTREIEGDSVADVLDACEHDPKAMIEKVREAAEKGVREGRIGVAERRRILDMYQAGLRGYTYFER